MRDVRLEAEVLDVDKPKKVVVRGSERTILEAIITDGTGHLKLVLWDDKILDLRPGDKVVIEGGVVTSYKGIWRLNVSKGGSIRKLGP